MTDYGSIGTAIAMIIIAAINAYNLARSKKRDAAVDATAIKVDNVVNKVEATVAKVDDTVKKVDVAINGGKH